MGARRPDGLLLTLGAPTRRDGRPRRPDTKTITDALAVHGADYDRILCAFTAALARTQYRDTGGDPLRRCLHVDGKAQHGAARPGGRTPMLLSARADDGTVAAQHEVPVDKTNEITRMLYACTVREFGFGYAACSYSLINPCSTFLRRTLTAPRSGTGTGSTSRSGGRCPRP